MKNISIRFAVCIGFFLIFAILLGVLFNDRLSGHANRDYTLQQFGNFEKDWQLVTVRYRKDTEEIRLVYANSLAWKALQDMKLDYPDGAVFAKIGMGTKQDSAFPSSVVPAELRRTQFMIRNRLKHDSTDGWGYALFDGAGQKLPDESMNCAACHRLVRERGEVFSQPLHRAIFGSEIKDWHSKVLFEERGIGTLPQLLRNALPRNITTINTVSGDLIKSVFSGTLDEIQPVLAQNVLRTGRPSAFVASAGTSFSVVLQNKDSTECQSQPGKTSLKELRYMPSDDKQVFEKVFCATLGE